jgi:hypothetical protein
MNSEVGTNDPSKLRIRIPKAPYINNDTECSDEVLEERQGLVPMGWRVEKSKKTGRCYYVNDEKGITQWEFPGMRPNYTSSPEEKGGSTFKKKGGSRKYKKRKHKKVNTIKRRK